MMRFDFIRVVDRENLTLGCYPLMHVQQAILMYQHAQKWGMSPHFIPVEDGYNIRIFSKDKARTIKYLESAQFCAECGFEASVHFREEGERNGWFVRDQTVVISNKLDGWVEVVSLLTAKQKEIYDRYETNDVDLVTMILCSETIQKNRKEKTAVFLFLYGKEVDRVYDEIVEAIRQLAESGNPSAKALYKGYSQNILEVEEDEID